jgi:hypothetical protein
LLIAAAAVLQASRIRENAVRGLEKKRSRLDAQYSANYDARGWRLFP